MREYVLKIDHNELCVIVSESRERGYAALIEYLIKRGYEIHGLVKTRAVGDTDSRWKDYYVIIDGGGMFAQFFDEVSKSDSTYYLETPMIVDYPELSSEVIQDWARIFEADGREENMRRIYVSKKGVAYRFIAEPVQRDYIDSDKLELPGDGPDLYYLKIDREDVRGISL